MVITSLQNLFPNMCDAYLCVLECFQKYYATIDFKILPWVGKYNVWRHLLKKRNDWSEIWAKNKNQCGSRTRGYQQSLQFTTKTHLTTANPDHYDFLMTKKISSIN